MGSRIFCDVGAPSRRSAPSNPLAAGLVAAVVAASTGGCSFVVDGDRHQCSVDADCKARGPAFAGSVCVSSFCEVHQGAETDSGDPTWGCLEQPRVTKSDPGPFQVTLHLQDVVSQGAVAGVTARLCRKLDVDCAEPESDDVVTDDGGNAVFQVPKGFTGYVSVTRDGIVPGLYFFNPSIDGDLSATVQTVSPTIEGLLTKSLGSEQQADRGLILMNVIDCEGKPAGEIQYRSDAADDQTVVFYAIDGLPQSMATATDRSGYGGLVNVPPGTVSVTGAVDGSRDIATVSLYVKAGAITYSRLVPHGP